MNRRTQGRETIVAGENSIGWMNIEIPGDIEFQRKEAYKAAVKWYRRAAEQGNAEAQGNLGLMYLDGKGVLQDNIRAYIWLHTAASQGYL